MLGWQQLLIVLVLAVLLFGGRGRISGIMGDMAKGIKAFKKGMNEDEDTGTASRTELVDHDDKTERAGVTDTLHDKTKA